MSAGTFLSINSVRFESEFERRPGPLHDPHSNDLTVWSVRKYDHPTHYEMFRRNENP